MSGTLGNGIVVWFEGQNETICHISPSRKLTMYKHDYVLTKKEQDEILSLQNGNWLSTSNGEKNYLLSPLADVLRTYKHTNKVTNEVYNVEVVYYKYTNEYHHCIGNHVIKCTNTLYGD